MSVFYSIKSKKATNSRIVLDESVPIDSLKAIKATKARKALEERVAYES